MESLLEINFDTTTQKYWFILPAEVCDTLLLDYDGTEGLRLCHPQKSKLEEFRKMLLELSLATEILRERGIKTAKRKVSQALFLLIVVIAVIFLKEPILKSYPSLKWPLYVGVPSTGVFCCVVIFLNYINPAQSDGALPNSLGTIALHQRITRDFSC